ncbi:MAG TPA: VCBS repeat-containing protein, partial [Bryobacteraceae bacterium]
MRNLKQIQRSFACEFKTSDATCLVVLLLCFIGVKPVSAQAVVFSRTDISISGKQPSSIFAADVNNDGHPDVITGNMADSSISVLLGNGDGTFSGGPHYS